MLGIWGQWSFGNNAITNIGDDGDHAVETSGPIDFSNNTAAAAIAAGLSHTCALLSGGNVRCWGLGSNGRLGNNTTTGYGYNTTTNVVAASGPIAFGNNATATAIVVGGDHSCAVIANETMKCWGSGVQGQLGNGILDYGSNTTYPVANSIISGLTVAVMDAGKFHTCAIVQDKTVKCWGSNDKGQLGLASSETYGTPTTNACTTTPPAASIKLR